MQAIDVGIADLVRLVWHCIPVAMSSAVLGMKDRKEAMCMDADVTLLH